jgi:predicted RNA-binding Zn-ribbon protein involved in translation (DUF1610 family)
MQLVIVAKRKVKLYRLQSVMNKPEVFVVHISRGGAELGSFPWSEIRSLIASGSVLPTDHYWREGMAEWRLVGETWASQSEINTGVPTRLANQCPSCGKEVSPQAFSCPHCGHPLQKGFMGRGATERALNQGCLVIVIIVVVFLILFQLSR